MIQEAEYSRYKPNKMTIKFNILHGSRSELCSRWINSNGVIQKFFLWFKKPFSRRLASPRKGPFLAWTNWNKMAVEYSLKDV